MIAPLLAVVGLNRESALVAGAGVTAVAGGGNAAGLTAALERSLSTQRPRAVVSVGLGGALSPKLRVGDWVVGERVVCGAEIWRSDPGCVQHLRRVLSRHGDRVFPGDIAGSDVMIVDAGAKAALHAATGALAVDMESHVAARFAAAHALPFAALRVISDGADHALPPAAQAGMKTDGGMDILAVLRALARDPRQLPALIRTGREAEVAFRQLKLLNRHDLLGRLGVGDADLGQLPLDVV